MLMKCNIVRRIQEACHNTELRMSMALRITNQINVILKSGIKLSLYVSILFLEILVLITQYVNACLFDKQEPQNQAKINISESHQQELIVVDFLEELPHGHRSP